MAEAHSLNGWISQLKRDRKGVLYNHFLFPKQAPLKGNWAENWIETSWSVEDTLQMFVEYDQQTVLVEIPPSRSKEPSSIYGGVLIVKIFVAGDGWWWYQAIFNNGKPTVDYPSRCNDPRYRNKPLIWSVGIEDVLKYIKEKYRGYE